MQHDRRQFLKLALTGAVWIGAGSVIKSIAGNRFLLPPASDILLRVAIASDGHFGQPGTTWQPHHDEMVAWINHEKAARGVDFTCVNGDLFHNDPAYLEPVKNQWDKLTMPFYVSHGNHDMVTEETWTSTWKNPWHYGFEKKGIGFIVLNTADDTGKYISSDIEKTKQLLGDYSHNNQLFVFMHITPFTWTKGGLACPDVVKMFDIQQNLKAIFHGHDHDQDNVKENNGKHYFFDSHTAGNWGTDYRGYRMLEIMKNGDILTYQMNPASHAKVNTLDLS